MAWRRLFWRLVAVGYGGSAALLVLLALLDPWGVLPFRSPIPRLPADPNQRWAVPELARDPGFDAAVIGNSASRLLNPADLDPAAGARFVNLAILNGRAYEQSRLLDVFLRAHPTPRAVLIGVQQVWCERGDAVVRFGYGPIPEWLYDGDWVAGLANLLNLHALDTALRSLKAELGLARRPYAADGYRLIDVDAHAYDKALAATLIAKGLAEVWPPPPGPDPASWRYLPLEWLQLRLDRIPAETRVLLVFVPHYDLYPPAGSDGAAMLAECQRRVVAMARARPRTEVYDMAFANRLTLDPERWWDPVHGRPETMAEASRALADAMAGRDAPLVRRVVPGSDPASASLR